MAPMVERIMREDNLLAVQPGRFVTTPDQARAGVYFDPSAAHAFTVKGSYFGRPRDIVIGNYIRLLTSHDGRPPFDQ
jgi:hypothetical protein